MTESGEFEISDLRFQKFRICDFRSVISCRKMWIHVADGRKIYKLNRRSSRPAVVLPMGLPVPFIASMRSSRHHRPFSLVWVIDFDLVDDFPFRAGFPGAVPSRDVARSIRYIVVQRHWQSLRTMIFLLRVLAGQAIDQVDFGADGPLAAGRGGFDLLNDVGGAPRHSPLSARLPTGTRGVRSPSCPGTSGEPGPRVQAGKAGGPSSAPSIIQSRLPAAPSDHFRQARRAGPTRPCDRGDTPSRKRYCGPGAGRGKIRPLSFRRCLPRLPVPLLHALSLSSLLPWSLSPLFNAHSRTLRQLLLVQTAPPCSPTNALIAAELFM